MTSAPCGSLKPHAEPHLGRARRGDGPGDRVQQPAIGELVEVGSWWR